MYLPSFDNFNTKIKTYPNGKRVFTYCNTRIFHYPKDPEDLDTDVDTDVSTIDTDDCPSDPDREKDEEEKAPDPSNQLRAMRRAKDRIFDIAFSNDWTHFCTLTIDGSLLDSSNVQDTMKSMGIWLDNMHQRKQLSYLLCPEYHHDGNKIHAHSLIKSGDLRLIDSGTRLVQGYDRPVSLNTIRKKAISQSQIQAIVYNMPDWKYGFSTAIPKYGDVSALATYVTKYITKNCCKIFGKYYWSSKDLNREVHTEYCNTDFGSVPGEYYEIPNTGLLLKYKTELTYFQD